MASETTDSAVGLQRRNRSRAVERICTSTTRGLSSLTLLVGLRRQVGNGGRSCTDVDRLMRPACELTRSPQSAAERNRTSTTWSLKPPTLPLVYGGIFFSSGNAGTCTQLSLRLLYRQP